MQKNMIATAKRQLNDRQETFCQIKANEDVSNSEAYRRAGYSAIGADTHSARLVVKGRIKARIAILRAERREKLEVNRETQADKYENVRRRCKDDGDYGNEIRALNGLDKLYGLSIDKQQTETTAAQQALDAKEKALADRVAKQLLDEDMGVKTGVIEVER